MSMFLHVYGIIGGYDIDIQDAPYQINYGDICGGVLIGENWAITTAHCGTEPNYIKIGSRYRHSGFKVKITKHILHPIYGRSHRFDYDIQLLKFRRLHFSKLVAGIRISEGECGSIRVSGWGYPKEKGDYNDVLQQVQLNIVPMEICQAVNRPYYNQTLTERMFCAGGDEQDACQGDSGGSAVSFGRLVGLSAFGFGCGRNIPGVYVNVSNKYIRNWIRYYTALHAHTKTDDYSLTSPTLMKAKPIPVGHVLNLQFNVIMTKPGAASTHPAKAQSSKLQSDFVRTKNSAKMI
ncbi:transmembrane protease serine 9-like [Achroia grisella]|uniref:transmembrane protease serine 9-like n=1 Tax=Achroia grisella TaxID=688607 RepID=UPI0027D24992|nr:transmembrane protease serine 9-like [Achroia grisella]